MSCRAFVTLSIVLLPLSFKFPLCRFPYHAYVVTELGFRLHSRDILPWGGACWWYIILISMYIADTRFNVSSFSRKITFSVSTFSHIAYSEQIRLPRQTVESRLYQTTQSDSSDTIWRGYY